MWDDEFERLSARVDVIAWDAPGCGMSGDVPATWDAKDWANAASGFIQALGLSTPVVAGFSLGSVIAILLARHHPGSVGRLVLVGAYAGWAGSLDADSLARRIEAVRFTMEHPVDEWADAFLDSVFAPDAPPRQRARARILLDDWRPATTAALLGVLVQDLRPELAFISTPTLVVRGAEDARSPRRASERMVERLPDARLVEIPGAGHDCSGPELDALLVAWAEGRPPRSRE